MLYYCIIYIQKHYFTELISQQVLQHISPATHVTNYKQKVQCQILVTVVSGFHGYHVTTDTTGECCITCAGAVTGLDSGTLKTTCILHKVSHQTINKQKIYMVHEHSFCPSSHACCFVQSYLKYFVFRKQGVHTVKLDNSLHLNIVL